MIGTPSLVLLDPDADVQAAIDAAAPGSVIQFGPGAFERPTVAGSWVIDKALTIEGAGSGSDGGGVDCTWFKPSGGDKDSTVFTIAADNVTIRNCYIGNATKRSSRGTGDGIRIGKAGSTLEEPTLENVKIFYNGNHGINASGDGLWSTAIGSEGIFSDYAINIATWKDVQCGGNRGCGMRLWPAANLQVIGGMCIGNDFDGLRAIFCASCNFIGLELSENCQDATNDATYAGQVYINTGKGVNLIGVQFEQFQQFTNKNGLVLAGARGCVVQGSQFINQKVSGNYVAGTNAIILRDDTHGCTISSCAFGGVGSTIYIAVSTGVESNFIGPTDVLGADANAPAWMNITDAGSNFVMIPKGSYGDGLGELNKTGGVILPKLSGGVAALNQQLVIDGEAGPVNGYGAGLLIYDADATADKRLKYYDGAAWRYLTGTTV